jgi:RHS repeat-associated protein
MLESIEHAPDPPPLPVLMADDPCEAAFDAADPAGARNYYRARYYDPKIGRFISEDPIGFVGGVNFYAYVHDNPLLFIDPFGLHTLVFDGRGVTIRDDAGQFQGYIPATSGRDGVTDPSVPWKGPIPPGEYELNPSEITPGSWKRDLTGDWGDWRVPLHPLPGTDTMGRNRFFLHGGDRPGSGGCIDVGKRDRHLFEGVPLIGHEGPVRVIVRYD